MEAKADIIEKTYDYIKEWRNINRICNSITQIWDSMKRSNLWIIDIEEEVQTKGIGNKFNKITVNFPNLEKEMPI
jgi:hypothetical protein